MFRPRQCPFCGSADVHRYAQQWLYQNFFLLRPFRCFSCNQRFTRCTIYGKRLRTYLEDRAKRAESGKVGSDILVTAEQGDTFTEARVRSTSPKDRLKGRTHTLTR